MRAQNDWCSVVVTGIRDVAPAIREIAFAGADLPPAYPIGSHIQVQVVVAGRVERRHYSLVGDRPVDGRYRVAVRRQPEGRGGSRYMWSLTEGARLEVSHPASHFGLSNDVSEALLIAGGIGITPILGMAQSLARRGVRFALLYAGRGRADMAYLPELMAICGPALTVAATNEAGRADLAVAIASLPPHGEAYVCGPLGLLEAAKTAWRHAGRPRDRLVYETFGASGTFPTEAFTVRIARLDAEVAVPADMTILDALERAGIGVLSECRRGECGLCQMDILDLDGELDHRDVFFSDEQRQDAGKICVCVSRVSGGGRVVLQPAWRGDHRLRSGRELETGFDRPWQGASEGKAT